MALQADIGRPGRAAAIDPMAPTPMTVGRVWDEIDDTFSLELRPANGDFVYAPGQFTMLYVFGVGEVPISISGDPQEADRIVQTIRGVGAVTHALREARTGTVLGVRGPFGVGWPLEAAEGRTVVVVGGGIGLAPLRPAIYHLLAHRNRFEQLVVLYGARSPRDILYPEELAHWGGRFDVDVMVTVDNADRRWHGQVGVVTKLISRAPFDPHEATVFVCGPEVMMRYCTLELMRRGVDPDQIYVSMERNMKCAVGFCGHCQYGPKFVCRDGPVFRFGEIEWLFRTREV